MINKIKAVLEKKVSVSSVLFVSGMAVVVVAGLIVVTVWV